jgi:ribosome biogenesis GTPase / thiamine phosphate phosphatase
LRGEVLFGMHSIYTVHADGRRLLCRIKGKVLKADERAWNPIAPGDSVEIDPDLLSPGQGKILGLAPRRTVLQRWNKKGRAPQVLAANADLAVCITTPCQPPFRPRFIDRLIVAAETGGMLPLIVLNKCDLGVGDDVQTRLAYYSRMGYEVRRCSAVTGEGIPQLGARLAGSTAVIVGQSGVGKSSLLNALSPGFAQKVGDLSAKHDRGSHTTNYPILLQAGGGLRLIDTPGIRELELVGVNPSEVAFHFRDFIAFMAGCRQPSCLHHEESGCSVQAASESGEIHPDRLESYRRILGELDRG